MTVTIKKQTTTLILTLLATLFLAACQDEAQIALNGTDPHAPGLHVALSLGGRQPLYQAATRASSTTMEGENSLGENTVSTVHFFLFNPTVTEGSTDTTWTFKKSWLSNEVKEQDITADNTTNDATTFPDYYPTEYFTLYSGNNWADALGIVKGSRLYAIANLSDEKAETVTSWETLKSLAVTDTDIYKVKAQSETAGTQETTDKLFLMDGFYRFTQSDLDASGNSEVHQVTVSLRRAAAKVRVNIYKATSWTTDTEGKTVTIDQNNITAKVMNYATQTKVVAPEGTEGLGDTSPANTYAELQTTTKEGAASTSNSEYLKSVLFYTFAHDWSENIGKETTFIMNLPYTDGARPNNWYKIVFVPNGGQAYARNTFYEVDVTVAYDGSADSYEPELIQNPVYKVSEWYPESFDVDNTTPVDYLILDKYFVDMRNVADATVTFYSSNNVTVEVVHDVDTEIETLGDEFPWPEGFPGRDSYIGEDQEDESWTLPNIPGIYYPDKENRRIPIYTTGDDGSYNTTSTYQDLNRATYPPVTVKSYTNGTSLYESEKTNSEVYITWPGDEHSESGKLIHLYSAIPRNATLRFITLKVTMDKLYSTGTITRYIIIKQYPLEYIVNQFGYYSFFDGNTLTKSDMGSQQDNTYSMTGKNILENGLYRVYCGDLEAGKSKWVFIPDSITNGLGQAKEIASDYYFPKGIPCNYALNGHFSRYPNMKCKFFLDGTAKTHSADFAGAYDQHTWSDAEGTHHGIIYQIDAMYGDSEEGNTSDVQGLDANTPSNNNRMYEVTITATSPQYRIGYPEITEFTDDNGNKQLYAKETYENALLVSPHFVIASQLGNSSTTAYWETAHDQCAHYVEVDNKGNVFKDWRLPTIAELTIIKQYQLDDNVFNVTMNRILNSDGDGTPRYWTAGRYWYVDTTGEGIAHEQTRDDDKKIEVKYGAYAGEYIGTPNSSNEVRIRCVRDIKPE